MDPNNPIVMLCVQGMQAEAEGRMDDARNLFSQAWESSTDDFEACIAAHYLARHQESPEDILYWNQEALNRAEAAVDRRVQSFYPSLYLNMGYSYELLGEADAAIRYYKLAAEKLEDLPPGPYGEVVRGAVQRGQVRSKNMKNLE